MLALDLVAIADAVRYELKTGELLSPSGHFTKAREMITALQRRIDSGELSDFDKSAAQHIMKDLIKALENK